MTTQEEALAQLFGAPVFNTGKTATSGDKPHYRTLPEPITTSPSPTRRRVEATYCPKCGGWVEVRLQLVRLHCTRCGLEARP